MEDCDDARSRSALLGRLDIMSGRIPVRKQGKVRKRRRMEIIILRHSPHNSDDSDDAGLCGYRAQCLRAPAIARARYYDTSLTP